MKFCKHPEGICVEPTEQVGLDSIESEIEACASKMVELRQMAKQSTGNAARLKLINRAFTATQIELRRLHAEYAEAEARFELY